MGNYRGLTRGGETVAELGLEDFKVSRRMKSMILMGFCDNVRSMSNDTGY